MDDYPELLEKVEKLIESQSQLGARLSSIQNELNSMREELDEMRRDSSASEQTVKPCGAIAASGVDAPLFVDNEQAKTARQEELAWKRGTVKSPYRVGAPKKPRSTVQSDGSSEFKVGKQVMSVLASLLVLVSAVLFGALLYPYLTDGMKVCIMYTISVAFIAVGMLGRAKSKYKMFFTALAGCGVGAFYLSGVISYFLFELLSLEVLFAVTYIWVLSVAYISRKEVGIFSYIAYAGIVVSTFLCMYKFPCEVISFVCYMLGICTLYAFCASKDFKKDLFYFIQCPVMLGILLISYEGRVELMLSTVIIGLVSMVAQHYIYKSKDKLSGIVVILTDILCIFGYLGCMETSIEPLYLNVFYIGLSAAVSLWCYYSFDWRWLKVGTLCLTCLLIPQLELGAWWGEHIGYIPFAYLILVVGFIVKEPVIKGVSVYYLCASVMDYVRYLDEPIEEAAILGYCICFGVGVWYFNRESKIDKLLFEIAGFITISEMYFQNYDTLWVIGACLIVVLAVAFNSSLYKQPSGYIWNALWGCICVCTIWWGSSDKTAWLLLCLLALIMLNARKQVVGGKVIVCVKLTAYLILLLRELDSTGVVLSVLFLVLAVACVIVGALIKSKSIRLYGLALSIVSVVKCLLLDVQYNSSVYRPVGLFVAGLLCFGISYTYSVLERKLVRSFDDNSSVNE